MASTRSHKTGIRSFCIPISWTLATLKPLLKDMGRRLLVNASGKPYLSVRILPGEKPLDVLGEALAHLEAAKTISCEEL